MLQDVATVQELISQTITDMRMRRAARSVATVIKRATSATVRSRVQGLGLSMIDNKVDSMVLSGLVGGRTRREFACA